MFDAPARPDLAKRQRVAIDALHHARQQERVGDITEAIARYEVAVSLAVEHGEQAVEAEGLRRVAALWYKQGQIARAREACQHSYDISTATGNEYLAAEALNTLGVLELTRGSMTDARAHLLRALELGSVSPDLGARVEQNLGILANIQGDLDEASRRYRHSLEAYRAGGNEHGCAIAYCNLGMASADQELHEEAGAYFQQSLAIAVRAGDQHLQGLCLVNQAESELARQRYEDALRNAEAALALFDKLGAGGAKSDAYRVIGVVYRETSRLGLAESRLRTAMDLAVQSGASLNQAEASRELALLYQAMGRNQEALTLLNAAHQLFQRLDARVDLVHVGGKVAQLEGTYLAVVREWGQSIESADSYTFGHCGRVADNAVAVAQALGLDAQAQTAIRLGAYLHDLGKVKVPHEILNKTGPLTRDEFEVIQMHPVWGVDLLAAIEFPWDLKPIIRWHHEKYDGTGYPDRLRGDEIPLSAQIVGIVDMYDALTTTRAYRAAMSHTEAIAEITRCRSWWSGRVFEAFRGVMESSSAAERAVSPLTTAVTARV